MTPKAASLTVLILMLACVVFAATPHATSQCVNDEDRDRIRELALQGIDKAFQDQVEHLFAVWMKDSSDQPRRATVGMEHAISARQRARANAMSWNPTNCN